MGAQAMKSKRPWRQYAVIIRTELNNGDVKYITRATKDFLRIADHAEMEASFEDLTSAEAHLDAWWEKWWPKQVKSRGQV